MDRIAKRFNTLMLTSLIMPLIDIIIGILFIQFPDLAVEVNVRILAGLILIHGIYFLIRYIYDGLGNRFFAIDLIMSTAAIILGIFTFYNPFKATKALGPLFCIWLCVTGIEKIYYAYRFMKKQESSFPLTLFIGVLMIMMGIIVCINPFKSFMIITKLVGLFLICSGLLEAMICNLFRQRSKKILEIFK